MVTILLNKARKHYRRRRVETVALEEAIEAPENSDGPEDMMEREEEAHRLRLALERLSSNHREALVLRYYNDLTVPEIAKVDSDCDLPVLHVDADARRDMANLRRRAGAGAERMGTGGVGIR